MSNQVLSCENVKASYGAIQALHGVNLEVNEGEIVVVLGANGAGKSTFMKCLLQLLKPTSGKAWLLGRDIASAGRDIRTRVGYAPEQDCHIPGMVGCEYVTYCAQLSGMPFQDARQRAHEMLDFVGLTAGTNGDDDNLIYESNASNVENLRHVINYQGLDSPTTTNATTYKLQVSQFVNSGSAGVVKVCHGGYFTSRILLMEVSA